MNQITHPPPQNIAQISIEQIIQIRIALDSIKHQTASSKDSITNLDRIILTFTSSLSNTQGPTQ